MSATNEENTTGGALTQAQKDELFENNVKQINVMYVPAGSMIKAVLWELQRNNRDTYLRLRDAVPQGHIVYYDFVAGDPGLVARIGGALGLKTVTSSMLEVRGG